MRAVHGAHASGRFLGILLLGAALAALAAPAAQAQPFGAWATFSGPTNGYINIPDSAALNPTGAITIEAWVNVSIPGASGCVSLVGKGWTESWWLGVCQNGINQVLRSYVRGYDSTSGSTNGKINRDAGIVPVGQWTHIAVVWNGTQRLHYINGEQVGVWAESQPLTTSTRPVRIGSDYSFANTPHGAIDEVRIWNVARSVSQIRGTINVITHTPQAGLVAVWPLDASPNDPVGGHNGTVMGSGVAALTFPAILNCGSSTVNGLCLNTRFAVTAKWRTNPTPGTPTDGDAHVVVAGPNSGIFWFFSSDNWEVMVKVLNACGLNNRYWVFSAATTNVFYRMEVFDVRAGVNKVYFNYPGPPAPAVTDVDAFATCP
jgi:hypothetical protein